MHLDIIDIYRIDRKRSVSRTYYDRKIILGQSL